MPWRISVVGVGSDPELRGFMRIFSVNLKGSSLEASDGVMNPVDGAKEHQTQNSIADPGKSQGLREKRRDHEVKIQSSRI